MFEYHAIESMWDLNSMGDNTKYFIELYHQDGAYQDICTKGLRDYKQNHESQHKADNWESHLKVHNAKERMRAKMKLHAKKDATKEMI